MSGSPIQPAPVSPNPFQPAVEPPAPRGGRSWVWILAAGAILGMCCCSGICLVPAGVGVYQAASERDDVEREIQDFMSALDAGNVDAAMNHFSSRALRTNQTSREKIKQLLDNPAFRGCQAVHITSINVNRSYNTNQDVPQGVVAIVSGTLHYQNGSSRPFHATLEKEGSQWKLHTLRLDQQGNADPSPEKPPE